jgi:hypothetical protein
MTVKEELAMIKEGQQTLAGLDLEKKKVYDEIREHNVGLHFQWSPVLYLRYRRST